MDRATERLVAFSCKGRGFCPSRGGRRMMVDMVVAAAQDAIPINSGRVRGALEEIDQVF